VETRARTLLSVGVTSATLGSEPDVLRLGRRAKVRKRPSAQDLGHASKASRRFPAAEAVGTRRWHCRAVGWARRLLFSFGFGALLTLTSRRAHPDGLWTSAWYLLAASCAAALGCMKWAVRGIELGKKASAQAIA
jgi:hypothetical protein